MMNKKKDTDSRVKTQQQKRDGQKKNNTLPKIALKNEQQFFFIIFTFTVHLIGMTMKNDIKW